MLTLSFNYQVKNMYFKSIQLLRCIAAIYITFFHLIYWWNQQQDGFTGIFDKGYGAVDLFFVISGFVIAQSAFAHQTGWYPFLVFLKKRLIRIYPIYWVFLGVFLITGMIDLSNVRPIKCLQAVFLLPGHQSLIQPAWTLQYELFFYILVSLVVLSRRFKYLLAALFLLTLVSLVVRITGSAKLFLNLPEMGFYNEFVFEFFLGTLALRIHNKVPFAMAVVLTATGAVLFLFPQKIAISQAIAFGIPSAMLITGLTALEKRHAFRVPRMLVLLGDASYCLYLLHGPVIAWLLPFPATPGSTSRWLLAGIVAALIIASIPIHLFVEKPLLQFLNNSILAGARIKKKDKGDASLSTSE